MDLRQLKYFIAVFEHGSVSRAAAEIPISQPALTRSVLILEQELGVSLFRRHARGVIATSAGERFYRHAYKILASCERAEEDVRSAGDYLAGEISMGVTALFAYTIMERIVGEFCEKHPRVRVTIHQGLLGDLLSGLERGDIELALCNFPLQSLPDIHVAETLLELSSYAYASSDHTLAGMRNVSWKSASEAKWVNFNQPHSQEAFEALFLNQNLAPPRVPVLSNSLALIKSMILRRGFVGLLPEQLMAGETGAGTIKRLKLPGTPIVRKAGLITLRDASNSPLSELFAEDVRGVCQEFSAVSRGDR
ncbi:MAG: LysR family transcriptional regulator [Chromatocurvus sp.]